MYFAVHPEISYFSQDQDRLFNGILNGKVVEITVLNENHKVCSCKLTHCKCGHPNGCNFCTFVIGKWPIQHWGKLRGLFNNRADAEQTLLKPLPKFDHDGKKM
jgi:hypothetical protein